MPMLFFLALFSQPQEDLGTLVRRLGDDAPAVRETAAARILGRWQDWKEEDLGKLRAASEGADRETAARAAEILRKIDLRRKHAPLLGRFKDLERVILSGSPEERRAVLDEVRRLWRMAEIDSAQAHELVADTIRHGFVPDFGDLSDLIRPFAPLLKPCLMDPDLRLDAILGARSIGAQELIPDLLPRLKDAEPRVRAETTLTLAYLGHRTAAEEVLPLVRDKDAKVRAAATETLGFLKSADLVPALVSLLKDPDRDVRIQAINSIHALGGNERVKDVVALLRDEDTYVRSTAAFTITDWGAREHAGEILSLLADTDGLERMNLADCIRRLGLTPLGDRILAYATAPESALRATAWELAAGLGPDFEEKPVEFLKHKDKNVREGAAWALVDRRRKKDAGVFLTLLGDPHPGLREAALYWFKTTGSREHVGDVVTRLDDPVPEVRQEAVRALGAMGAKEQIPRIARLLRDRDEHVCSQAILSMGWLGAREHTKDIVAHLTSASFSVWNAAIEALGYLGAREEMDSFAARLKDEDPRMRTAALGVLVDLDLSGQADAALDRIEEGDLGWPTLSRIMVSLGQTRSKTVLRRIEGLLSGPYADEALSALLAGGGPERLNLAMPLLASTERGTRYQTAWEIARWTARGLSPPDPARLARVLDRLEEDLDEGLRDAARVARVGLRWREPATVRELTDGYRGKVLLLALCMAHASQSFPRLFHPFVLDKDITSARELEATVQDRLGLRLEVSEDYHFVGCVRKGTNTTGMRLIDRLWRRDPGRGAVAHYTGFLVEGETIRIVLHEDAHTFWRAKLSGR